MNPVAATVRRRLLAEPGELPDGSALRARVARHLRAIDPLITNDRAVSLIDEVVRELDGFGAIEALFADPSVSEIMLNRPGVAYVERAGKIEPIELGLDAAAIVRVAERAIAPLGLRLDRSAPLVDARLPDGSRLHAVIPPLAPDGPCVTIRRFRPRRVGLDDFGVTDEVAQLLRTLVAGGANVLVAGGTSAGKTSLLAALAPAIDPAERVVTIEETAELDLGLEHVVRLEARPANVEGVGGASVRDLVRAALRMRPDRIVVGEVRGAEALDKLQALNTGHDGSLSTVHANGPDDALARLETLALFAVDLPLLAVRHQVAAAIDIVVAVRRDRDGRRTVEVVGECEPLSDGGRLTTRVLARRDRRSLQVVGEPRRPRCRR